MISYHKIKTICLVGIIFLLGIYSKKSYCQTLKSPQITLFTFTDELYVDHPDQDPLLLYVSIYNGYFLSSLMNNEEKQEIVKNFTESEEYKELSDEEKNQFLERYKIEEIPQFKLGSAQKPIVDLIQFTIKDQTDSEHPVKVRALAINDTVSSVANLNDDQPVILLYAIDSDALITLPKATYTIQAFIDTEDEEEMWQGVVYSFPVTIMLTDLRDDLTTDEVNARFFMLGTYFLEDRQFVKAEEIAQEMIEQDSDFIGGWIHMGNALAGQGRLESSLQAFKGALERFSKMIEIEKPEFYEPPDYILQRIYEIEEKLRAQE